MTILIPFAAFATLLTLCVIACKKHNQVALENAPEERIAVIKPIKGSALPFKKSIESFFKQDYKNYEIVFVIDDELNRPVIADIAQRHPEVDCIIIYDTESHCVNPKVSKLIPAYNQSSGNVVVISDVDVVAPVNYLSTINAQFADSANKDVGIITHPIHFKPNDSFWSRVFSVHLNTLIHGGLKMVNRFFRGSFPIGKSIAFKRKQFDQITSFGELGKYLGEDYMMGKKYQEIGLKTYISHIPIQSLMQETKSNHILSRMRRWSKMRIKSNKKAFVGELFLNPLAVGLTSLAISSFISIDKTILIAAVLVSYIFKLPAGILIRRDTGSPSRIYPILTVVSDLVHLFAWISTVVVPWVRWKDGKIYIGKDTIIRESSPALQRIKPILLMAATAMSAPAFYIMKFIYSLRLKTVIKNFLIAQRLYNPVDDSLNIAGLSGSLTNLTFIATVNDKKMVIKHFWAIGNYVIFMDKLFGPKRDRTSLGSSEDRFWGELMGNEHLKGLGWSVPEIYAYDCSTLIIAMEYVAGIPLDKIDDRNILLEEYERFGKMLSSLHESNTFLVDNYASHRILNDKTKGFYQLDLENVTKDGTPEWDISLFLFYLRYLYSRNLREELLKAFIRGYRITARELKMRLEPHLRELAPYGWLAQLAVSYR